MARAEIAFGTDGRARSCGEGSAIFSVLLRRLVCAVRANAGLDSDPSPEQSSAAHPIARPLPQGEGGISCAGAFDNLASRKLRTHIAHHLLKLREAGGDH